jgi:hypothetical protein
MKWADSVRSTAKYKFTAPFHFIDAEGIVQLLQRVTMRGPDGGTDDPLDGQCSVVQDRDCGSSGCICQSLTSLVFWSSTGENAHKETLVSAIANYTQRVQETSLAKAERQDALKFITHVCNFLQLA